MHFHSNAGIVPIYERLKEVPWRATVTPGLELRFSASQGHRQKSAHKRQLKSRESVPKEGSLAGGETYNVTLKGEKKKKALLLTGYFWALGLLFCSFAYLYSLKFQ